MKKNRIRLSESQLHKVIKESVNRILLENDEEGTIRPWNGRKKNNAITFDKEGYGYNSKGELVYHPNIPTEYNSNRLGDVPFDVVSESKLHKVIKESVKKVLKEVRGWSLEDDDLTLVNGKSCGKSLFIVKLWWGSGYVMDCYNAFADSEEEALNYVVTYIEKHNPDLLDRTDKLAQSELERLHNENPDMEYYEVDQLPEFYESFMYVDATMEGADAPHYIWSENLTVAKYPQNHNYPINKQAR